MDYIPNISDTQWDCQERSLFEEVAYMNFHIYSINITVNG